MLNYNGNLEKERDREHTVFFGGIQEKGQQIHGRLVVRILELLDAITDQSVDNRIQLLQCLRSLSQRTGTGDWSNGRVPACRS